MWVPTLSFITFHRVMGEGCTKSRSLICVRNLICLWNQANQIPWKGIIICLIFLVIFVFNMEALLLNNMEIILKSMEAIIIEVNAGLCACCVGVCPFPS